MKVHLAIAAAGLALSASAFPPTPTAAAPPPSGVLLCQTSLTDPVEVHFRHIGCTPFLTVGEAALSCINELEGFPVGVVLD